MLLENKVRFYNLTLEYLTSRADKFDVSTNGLHAKYNFPDKGAVYRAVRNTVAQVLNVLPDRPMTAHMWTANNEPRFTKGKSDEAIGSVTLRRIFINRQVLLGVVLAYIDSQTGKDSLMSSVHIHRPALEFTTQRDTKRAYDDASESFRNGVVARVPSTEKTQLVTMNPIVNVPSDQVSFKFPIENNTEAFLIKFNLGDDIEQTKFKHGTREDVMVAAAIWAAQNTTMGDAMTISFNVVENL